MPSTVHILRGVGGGRGRFGGTLPTLFGPTLDRRYEKLTCTNTTTQRATLTAKEGECWTIIVIGDPVVVRIYDAAGTPPDATNHVNELRILPEFPPLDIEMPAGWTIGAALEA